jgi:hypothetical protein
VSYFRKCLDELIALYEQSAVRRTASSEAVEALRQAVYEESIEEGYNENFIDINRPERLNLTAIRSQQNVPQDNNSALKDDLSIDSEMYMGSRADSSSPDDVYRDVYTEDASAEFDNRLKRVEDKKIDIEELSEEFLMDSRRYSSL